MFALLLFKILFCFGTSQNWRNNDRSLEMETWHDLANVYLSLSQWRDAEVCLSKSKAINPHSASRWHSTGMFTIYLLPSVCVFSNTLSWWGVCTLTDGV